MFSISDILKEAVEPAEMSLEDLEKSSLNVETLDNS